MWAARGKCLRSQWAQWVSKILTVNGNGDALAQDVAIGALEGGHLAELVELAVVIADALGRLGVHEVELETVGFGDGEDGSGAWVALDGKEEEVSLETQRYLCVCMCMCLRRWGIANSPGRSRSCRKGPCLRMAGVESGVASCAPSLAGCVADREEVGVGVLVRSDSSLDVGTRAGQVDVLAEILAAPGPSSELPDGLGIETSPPPPPLHHEHPTPPLRLTITMESPLLRTGFRRATATCHNPAKRRLFHRSPRCCATPVEATGPRDEIHAAPPIRFSGDNDQFAPRAEFLPERNARRSRNSSGSSRRDGPDDRSLLGRVRMVPASPSYFTATPRYIDNLLHLSALLRKHLTLPLLPVGEAPRVAWKTIDQYKTELAEPVRSKGYNALVQLLKRLNYIHPSLMPAEVTEALERYKRDVQPHLNVPKPILVNEWGVARAVGRRKASSAQVSLVEGEGECLINGRTLSEYFGRQHDRESAVWALKATQRLDKYNVWAVAQGGGTTGQAEAITLGLAKALLAHEPALKPALRRGESSSRAPSLMTV